MMTLAEAIEMRTRQAKLAGWKLGKRRQIEVQTLSATATLTLGWQDERPMAPAETSQTMAGDHAISLDLSDMPAGVTALEWTALPDTRDMIDTPTDSEVQAAALALGCHHVERGDAAGRIMYWMVA